MKNRIIRLSGLSVVLIACLFGCLSSQSRSAAPEVEASYLANTGMAPQPVWSQALSTPEADIIESMDGGRTLLGTMRLVMPSKFMSNFYFGQLSCLDTASGNQIWSISRDGFGKTAQALVASKPSIVILGSDDKGQVVTIIDPASGKILATRRPEGRISLIDLGQALAVPKVSKDTLSLEAISLADGRTRWQKDFPKMVGPTGEIAFYDLGSAFIIGGQSTVMLKCADGSTIWTSSESIAGAKLLAAGDYLLAGDSRGTRAIRLSDGKAGWKGPAAEVQLIASDGARAYVAAKAAQGIEIRAFDLSSGASLWSSPLDSLHSPMVFDESSIYVTMATDLVALRMNDGTRRMTARIDPAIQASTALADLLSIRGSRLYLGREQGIVAWDLSTGSQLYSVAVGGSPAGTLDYHDFKLASFGAALSGSARNHPAGNTQYAASQQNGVAAFAQSYQRYVEQKTAARAGTSTGRLASAYNMAAVQSMAAAEAAVNTAAAAIQFGLAVGQAIAAIGWAGEGAEAQASQLRMVRAVDTGYRTIYGRMLGERYYVRPNFRDGMRLTVVRLDDGARSDIRLFPGVPPFHGYGSWNIPAFALSSDEKTIVVRGMDPDSTRYTTREVMGGDAILMIAWAVPYPFVMNLPTERMRFTPEVNPPAGPARIDASAQALINAVIAGDKAKVNSLLKQGVSPDVCDELGHPVYSYAAQFFNAGIMRLLDDFGVDGLKTDPEGIRACDYLSYPMRPGDKAQHDAIMAESDALAKWKAKHKD